MLAAIRSAAVHGVEAYDVTVEVDAAKGLPQWTIVGLAAGAVREAKERVASALTNAGFTLPPRRYTINLAPGDQRKDGTAFDLPIALGVLVATGQLDASAVTGIAALGELGLDGALRNVRGVLPVALHLAKQHRPPPAPSRAPGTDDTPDAPGAAVAPAGSSSGRTNDVEESRDERCAAQGAAPIEPAAGTAPEQSPSSRPARGGAGDTSLILIVPPGNAAEAGVVSTLRSAAPPTISVLVEALRARATDANTPRARRCRDSSSPDRDTLDSFAVHRALPSGAPPFDPVGAEERLDLRDVVGQESAKRALEIAAAGGHALLLVGPPGGGKTMLARRLPGILPPLSEEEALEVMAVQSVAGVLATRGVLTADRPFRAPHHTLSVAALIGGGSLPRPGEVSLAHHGVLFLDELQEIPRSVLDALRQPMEDGRVVISRAQQSLAFPARFALVGAMNPCPCGQAGQEGRSCRCSWADVTRHRSRVSGPLADRLDMTIQLPAVSIAALGAGGEGEPSAAVRQRVVQARERQRWRYRRMRRVTCNAHVAGRWLDTHGGLHADARALLTASADRLQLSARGYHRVLKVARTIADLDGAEGVGAPHIAEALFVRTPENLPAQEEGG